MPKFPLFVICLEILAFAIIPGTRKEHLINHLNIMIMNSYNETNFPQ